MNRLDYRRILVWTMSRIHRTIYQASRGFAGSRLQGPVLLLTTVGKKTGRTHITPLLYLSEPNGWVVIGSYAGDPFHPHWWRNLQANPNALVQIGPKKTRVRARQSTIDERDRLWLGFVSIFPGYLKYEMRTSRRFPIVLLEPL